MPAPAVVAVCLSLCPDSVMLAVPRNSTEVNPGGYLSLPLPMVLPTNATARASGSCGNLLIPTVTSFDSERDYQKAIHVKENYSYDILQLQMSSKRAKILRRETR